jgi:hypothetical protein
MGRGLWRQGPALVLAGLALVAALSGTVYAGAKAKKINGKAIKAKSLPGNRLTMGSVPGNRLKPGAIQGSQLAPGSITGIHIDTSTLGVVPVAARAERAQSAQEAETAQNAVNAENAKSLNGYEAGCKSGTQPYAGACWQSDPNTTSLSAPAAAASCADEGGELPSALSLAAFAQQPGNVLADEEWTNEIPVISGTDLYSVLTVTPTGEVKSAASTATKRFRCVIPLVR